MDMKLRSRRPVQWSGRVTLMAVAAMLGITMLGGDAAMRAQSQDALGHGYSRPARSPHSSRSEVIAPHGMVAASQPLAAQVGIDILKGGRERDRRRGGGQRRSRAGRAAHERGRRRSVRHPLGRRDRAAPRPERHRPRAVPDQPRDAGQAGLYADAGQGAADVDGPGRGRRLARAAGAVRDAGARRRAGAGHRLRARRLSGERDHPAAVGRLGPRPGAVARLGGHLPARRAAAARRRGLQEPEPRRHVRGDRARRPRRVLQGRHRPPHRRLQRGERRLLHDGRLRGPLVGLGSSRSAPATAATTSGRSRRTAPASSP